MPLEGTKEARDGSVGVRLLVVALGGHAGVAVSVSESVYRDTR